MKQLSLKVRDEVFQKMEELIHQAHMPRNAYINQAIDFYNKLQRRRWLKKELARESAIVGQHSLEILREFENLDNENL